jgi:hypothetical protein
MTTDGRMTAGLCPAAHLRLLRRRAFARTAGDAIRRAALGVGARLAHVVHPTLPDRPTV